MCLFIFILFLTVNVALQTEGRSTQSMKDDSRHATPIDIESKGAIDGQEPFISDNDQQSVVIGLPQTKFEYIPEWQCAKHDNHVPRTLYAQPEMVSPSAFLYC
jgi:hypothetical protein